MLTHMMMPRLELHSAASTVLLRPLCSGPTTTPSTVCCRPEVRLTRHCTVHVNTSQHWTVLREEWEGNLEITSHLVDQKKMSKGLVDHTKK